MCGIVGYLGPQQAYPILIDGLKRLEYRGYDSAGVATLETNGMLRIEKSKEKLPISNNTLETTFLRVRLGLGIQGGPPMGRPMISMPTPTLVAQVGSPSFTMVSLKITSRSASC